LAVLPGRGLEVGPAGRSDDIVRRDGHVPEVVGVQLLAGQGQGVADVIGVDDFAAGAVRIHREVVGRVCLHDMVELARLVGLERIGAVLVGGRGVELAAQVALVTGAAQRDHDVGQRVIRLAGCALIDVAGEGGQ